MRSTTSTGSPQGEIAQLLQPFQHNSNHGSGMIELCPCCGQPAPLDFGRRLMIADIQDRVASYYGFPVSEMRSDRRGRVVARPRQVAMLLSRRFTPMSLPEIGRRFRRDHTTVIHACRQIERLCSYDDEMRRDVSFLSRELEELAAAEVAQL